MILEGIYFFPLATKQCSISAAHTTADIDATLRAAERVLSSVRPEAYHLAETR